MLLAPLKAAPGVKLLHQVLIAVPRVKLLHQGLNRSMSFGDSHSNPLTRPHSESLVSGPRPETAPRLELPGYRGLERSAILCKYPSSSHLAGREPGVAFGGKRASGWVRRLVQRNPDSPMRVMVSLNKHLEEDRWFPPYPPCLHPRPTGIVSPAPHPTSCPLC